MNFPKTFNYYPNTMINLSAIVYNNMKEIVNNVQNYDPDLQVVWGPAELVSAVGVSYSRMFVAKSISTNDYTVVIRGTNGASLLSWLKEDFDVAKMLPINTLAPGVPGNVTISTGAYNGLSYLVNMPDTYNTKTTLGAFLKTQKINNLYVTGQSLGGTLTPPMFVYLNALLYNANTAPTNMAMFSFAGLTAGGTYFNTYLNAILKNNKMPWRFHNTLDIAPLMVWNQNGVETIYKNINPKCVPTDFEMAVINTIFLAAGKQYAQPAGGDFPLNGMYCQAMPDFASQAMQQHHASPTYVDLIRRNFPYAYGG